MIFHDFPMFLGNSSNPLSCVHAYSACTEPLRGGCSTSQASQDPDLEEFPWSEVPPQLIFDALFFKLEKNAREMPDVPRSGPAFSG